MRRLALAAALMMLVCAACAPVSGEGALTAHPLLNAAFTLVEEGNPFQSRYNALTGAGIVSRLPLGVPYLWGGRTASHLFAKEPDYVVLPATSTSPVWYTAGRKYIYGYDCVGFVRHIFSEAGCSGVASISTLLEERSGHLWDERSAGLPPLGRLADSLETGDLIAMEHPGRHIAMYIGTLRDYGYTEDEAPELAPWLDHPLVIHSSVNAQIAERFETLIGSGPAKYRAATVTDGGVCVSLMTDTRGDAPFTVTAQKQLTSYFVLPDGTWLTVLPADEMSRFCWVRID